MGNIGRVGVPRTAACSRTLGVGPYPRRQPLGATGRSAVDIGQIALDPEVLAPRSSRRSGFAINDLNNEFFALAARGLGPMKLLGAGERPVPMDLHV